MVISGLVSPPLHFNVRNIKSLVFPLSWAEEAISLQKEDTMFKQIYLDEEKGACSKENLEKIPNLIRSCPYIASLLRAGVAKK